MKNTAAIFLALSLLGVDGSQAQGIGTDLKERPEVLVYKEEVRGNIQRALANIGLDGEIHRNKNNRSVTVGRNIGSFHLLDLQVRGNFNLGTKIESWQHPLLGNQNKATVGVNITASF